MNPDEKKMHMLLHPLCSDRGYAELNVQPLGEFVNEQLIASKDSLMKKTERLKNKEECLSNEVLELERIAKRTVFYPLPRLPNGQLTSVPKAKARLPLLRRKLSRVLAQERSAQATLRQMR
ncbi:MAG: hypothetical protein WC861_02030 [Candidatus Micrarchaeia archaeon]